MIRQPEEIEQLCRDHELATNGLRGRMDTDWGLYMLDTFMGAIPSQGEEARGNEAGYHHYTSNEPRSLYNKVHALIAGAKKVMTISKSGDPRMVRDVDNLKEEWLWGMLRQADDRLRRLLQPRLLNTLGYYIPLRGWSFGRCMLTKRPDGQTVVDLTPWDARHVYWGVGVDGLEWCVNKTGRTRGQVESEYGPLDSFGLNGTSGNPSDRSEIIEVFDYYDGEHNAVVVNGKLVKPFTAHMMPQIPVWYANVGNAPLVSGASGKDIKATADMDWGESIYSANRANYKLASYVASILLELLSRQRDQSFITRTREGSKTVGVNPMRTATEIPMAEGENIEPIPTMETTKDLALLWQGLQSEIQRGSIPYSAYGEIAFAISGFAINSLNGQVGSFISPRLEAIQDIYEQVSGLLIAQYSTGAFDTLSLSGYGKGKKYFSVGATPEAIASGGDPRFYLEAQLPQDDLGKIQAAGLLRQPGVNGLSLFSDDWIRTEHLKVRNEDNIRDQVMLQHAEMATPKAQLYSLLRAARNAGDETMARVYAIELVKLVQQEMLQLMMMGVDPAQLPANPAVNAEGSRNGGQMPGLSGFSPQTLPLAQQGIGPVAGGAAQSNPGPQVPPGTPRPGAQTGPMDRLATMGLRGPRG